MAVAGFDRSELSIEVSQNTLTVSTEKQAEDEKRNYLYQGIAARNFERRFQLADYVQVKGAVFENGILHVDLVREIHEAMKTRTIEIQGALVQDDTGAAADIIDMPHADKDTTMA